MIEFKKIFIDTCIFIYFIEQSSKYIDRVNNFFSYCLLNDIDLNTSSVSFMEFAVRPYETNSTEILLKFKEMLVDFNVSCYNIDMQIAELAAKYRSKNKWLKGTDVLQIAVALYSECDSFITNDASLKKINELNVILIDDWINVDIKTDF